MRRDRGEDEGQLSQSPSRERDRVALSSCVSEFMGGPRVSALSKVAGLEIACGADEEADGRLRAAPFGSISQEILNTQFRRRR